MFLNRGEGCGGWEVGRGEGSVKTGKRVLGRCLVMVSLGLNVCCDSHLNCLDEMVTPHLNQLVKTAQMRGHNIWIQ